MASIEDLPADLRGDLGPPRVALGIAAPREKPGGGTFIGGKAREYGANPPTPPVAPVVPEEAVKEKAEVPKIAEPCPRCEKVVGPDSNFCQNCGLDFKRRRSADQLGIEIAKDEIDDYLFKGFVVKAVNLFGEHIATFKSVQAGEIDQADELTAKYFEGKKPTDLEWLNYRSKCLISFGWLKLDGKPIGESPEKRLAWVQNAGSQLVDLVGKKFNLFNQCLTEVLNSDVIKNS